MKAIFISFSNLSFNWKNDLKSRFWSKINFIDLL